MPIPNLIHPISVDIHRQDRSVTIFDRRSRAPVRTLVRRGEAGSTSESLDLEAQVHFDDGFINRPRFPAGGKEEHTVGYLLFRYVDLIAAGVVTENPDGTVTVGFAAGDRIVRIGRRNCNYFVAWFRDVAGYDDVDELTLLEVNFADRNPADTRRSDNS